MGGGAYLAFTIAMFPAASAYRWFAPDALRLAGIAGTVWSGTAVLGSGPGLPMRDIHWDFRALPLLLGRVSASFEARLSDGFISAAATGWSNRLELSAVRVSTNLAALNSILNLGEARGLVSLSMDRLEIQDGRPTTAVGNVRVSGLEVAAFSSTNVSSLIPLGSFEARFNDTGGQGIAGTISDSGGPLEASGTLTLALDGSYIVEVLARARPDASEELLQGMQLAENFGMASEPDVEGRRLYTLTGSL